MGGQKGGSMGPGTTCRKARSAHLNRGALAGGDEAVTRLYHERDRARLAPRRHRAPAGLALEALALTQRASERGAGGGGRSILALLPRRCPRRLALTLLALGALRLALFALEH